MSDNKTNKKGVDEPIKSSEKEKKTRRGTTAAECSQKSVEGGSSQGKITQIDGQLGGLDKNETLWQGQDDDRVSVTSRKGGEKHWTKGGNIASWQTQ